MIQILFGSLRVLEKVINTETYLNKTVPILNYQFMDEWNFTKMCTRTHACVMVSYSLVWCGTKGYVCFGAVWYTSVLHWIALYKGIVSKVKAMTCYSRSPGKERDSQKYIIVSNWYLVNFIR